MAAMQECVLGGI